MCVRHSHGSCQMLSCVNPFTSARALNADYGIHTVHSLAVSPVMVLRFHASAISSVRFRNRNSYFRKVCELSTRMLNVLLLSRLSPAVRATSTARACLTVVNICNLCHGMRYDVTFDKLKQQAWNFNNL